MDVCVTKVLNGWKIVKHRDGNILKCFYAESNRRSESKMFSKTKNNKISLFRENYACPFLIRFSIPGVKTKTIPTIFREVNITQVVPHHTCGLCKQSFHTANRISKGSIKFDLNYLNSVVHMMKIDPHLSARYLRSILVGCVPLDTDIGSILSNSIPF